MQYVSNSVLRVATVFRFTARLTVGLLALGSLAIGTAQASEWDHSRPSNSGIPGEEIRFLRFAEDGVLWVGARWPFWGEGGVGLWHRDTQVWETIANWQSPIPSPYVNDLEFGPGGVVWIATDGGLVRKEGESWTVYTTSNSPLLHNRVRNIDLDSQGHVWINNTNPQNQDAALFEFDGESWRSFAVPEIPFDDPWRQLHSVHVDANDHVWVSSVVLPGIAEYDGESWTLRGEHINVFGSFGEDAQGYLWVITGNLAYEVYRYRDGQFVLFGGSTPPLSQTTITSLQADQEGNFYIGNWMGEVVKTTNNGASWFSFTQVSARVTGIAPDPLTGELWIGSAGAVHHIAPDGTWLAAWNSYNTGMPDYWVDRMTVDRDGYFWVATGEAGLSRFDGERWRNWGNHNAGSEPYPFAGNEPMGTAYQDSEGTHWFGGNGIARWDSQTGQFTGFWNWENNPGMGVSLWTHFAEDAAGHLFSAEEYGTVYRFDPEIPRWVAEPIQPYMPLGDLPGMEADSQGNIYVGAWFQLHKWGGTSWSDVGTDWGLFDLGGMNTMAIGPDDAIWMGTNEGVLHWDGVQLRHFHTGNSPLTGEKVQGIAVRPDGLVAVSAFGADFDEHASGVMLIDGDPGEAANWSVFRTSENPIPHWQLAGVGFDPQGDLWISALSMGAAILRLPDATDVDDDAAGEGAVAGMGEGVRILPALPNPFTDRAALRFALREAGPVRLEIFDAAGRRVRVFDPGMRSAGEHRIAWDGRDENGSPVASGVYWARVTVPGAQDRVRLVRVR